RQQLLSTVPFVITRKIRSKDGKVIPFSNPVFIMEVSGTPSTETFQLAYADAPSFAIDPKLGGNPRSPLVSVKRTVLSARSSFRCLPIFQMGRVRLSCVALSTPRARPST